MDFGDGMGSGKLLSAKGVEFSPPQVMLGSEAQECAVPTAQPDYLVALSKQTYCYCIGCVDMVNSTKISASISPQKLSKYYEVFLNSMSRIIGEYGGRVIKNIGDCLLYYFPNSLDVKSSYFANCIDCGLAMIGSRDVICEQLELQKIPPLDYRISADYGYVLVMNTTDSSRIDLIGPTVNMCAKINRCAASNELVIGGDLYEMVKKCDRYSFQQVRCYSVGFKQAYPVYKARLG